MFDIEQLYEYVYKEFKIKLDAYKEIQMNRRIEFFISKTSATSSIEFIKMCEINPSIKKEFLDLITINVTEFFRNTDIFLKIKSIFKKYIPKKDNYTIWSSACSNGSEPYSAAMILESVNIENYNILATDIDDNMLKYGRNGIYTNDEIKEVPNYYLMNYFDKLDEKYLVKKNIRDKVVFKRHDLILDEYPKDIDLILCRNVVIYFKKEEKMKIYNKFYNSLNPHGVVFIGATENIYDYQQIGFNKLNTFFYQKEVK